MEFKNLTISVFTIISTQLVFLFGGYDKLLSVLVVMVIIDYLTGLAKGYKNKQLNSYIGFKGISKKICLFFIVIIGNQFDSILTISEPLLRTTAIMFYIGNEGISITENMVDLGVKVPKIIKEKLLNFGGDK